MTYRQLPQDRRSQVRVSIGPPIPTGWLSASAFTLQLSPTAGAVVRNDLLEHCAESGSVDRFALAHGHGSGGRVLVAGGDDPLGIGDQSAVVEEHVEVV